MEKDMNIYQRMSAITNEIRRVAKNLNVDAGKSSYKAVGEADVLEAVKPAEEKFGVYSYPAETEIVESGEIVSESNYNGNVKTRKQLFLRVRRVYRFVNIDNPTEYVEVAAYGDGLDSGDKAPGKAVTYADKYALLKAYKITTGDDPDQKASEPMQEKKVEKNARVQMASDRQMAYIQRLYSESPENTAYIDKVYPDKTKPLTMREADEIIGALKK